MLASFVALGPSVIRTIDENDEEQDEEEDDQAIAVGGLTVLTRQDFAVTDYDGLIAAGRDAYLRTWPKDRPDDAARQVPDVGSALYELVHAGGRDALDDLDQLRPAASITVFHAQETLLNEEQIDSAVDAAAAENGHERLGVLDLFRTDGHVYCSFSGVHQ